MTWRKRFTRAKAWRADTGAGVTDKDKQVGIYSVESKLENMCPLFHRMNALIGSKANVTPLAIFDSSLLTMGREAIDRRLDECSSEASADSSTLEEEESWHDDFNNAEQENYETNEPTIVSAVLNTSVATLESVAASVARDVATAVDNAAGVAPTEAMQHMGGFSRDPNKRRALLASPTTQRLDKKQKTRTSDIASSFTQVEREKLQFFKAEADSRREADRERLRWEKEKHVEQCKREDVKARHDEEQKRKM